ncbi:MAG: shikimate kinase [Candidatus Gracilibacteria bacterium]|nr:shikimate kinase [Candidatus Gracilibacteria bacterium]
MNIILTGLRGSGKSKIGKLLSEKLNFKFIDIDKEIEKNENMSIKEIYEKHGWEYFRKKEKEAVKNLIGEDETIISLGGGTIVDPKNKKILKELGTIIYLERSPEDCYKYLKKAKTERPPLTKTADQLSELQKIYEERKAIYKTCSTYTIKRSDDLHKDVNKIIASFKDSCVS